MDNYTIRRITDVADVQAAAGVMITGVELTHPDKGTEMFLYELGVHEPYRRRGIGNALVEALADLAREHRCYGMWVLTEADNDAALGTYRSLGSAVQESSVGFTWTFDGESSS